MHQPALSPFICSLKMLHASFTGRMQSSLTRVRLWQSGHFPCFFRVEEANELYHRVPRVIYEHSQRSDMRRSQV